VLAKLWQRNAIAVELESTWSQLAEWGTVDGEYKSKESPVPTTIGARPGACFHLCSLSRGRRCLWGEESSAISFIIREIALPVQEG